MISSEARHTGPFSTGATDGIMRVTHLTFAYGTTEVFKELSVAARTRLIVLRGPSGCGKTTLLKLLAGFLVAASGTIEPIFRKPILISQEDALFPWLTGSQNITKLTGASAAQIEQSPLYPRIRSFLSQRAFRMSFGQRRLIELARALLCHPDLLCLDEPFNFIDPPSRALLQETLLTYLSQARDLTIVVSSHYESDFAIPRTTEFLFDGSLPVSQLDVRQRA